MPYKPVGQVIQNQFFMVFIPFSTPNIISPSPSKYRPGTIPSATSQLCFLENHCRLVSFHLSDFWQQKRLHRCAPPRMTRRCVGGSFPLCRHVEEFLSLYTPMTSEGEFLMSLGTDISSHLWTVLSSATDNGEGANFYQIYVAMRGIFFYRIVPSQHVCKKTASFSKSMSKNIRLPSDRIFSWHSFRLEAGPGVVGKRWQKNVMDKVFHVKNSSTESKDKELLLL